MNKKIQNTQNWLELKKLLGQYQVIVDNGLKDFSINAKSPSYTSVIYQNILQRIYFGVRTSEILLGLLNQSYFKFSIAIQLRSAILDSMIAIYLIDFVKNEADFKNQIANLSHQTARNINLEIEEKSKKKLISKESRNQLFETLSQIFPGNFDLNGKKTFNSTSYQGISANKMVEIYCQNPNLNTNQRDWMTECYALYKHFSTYEHYNAFSKTLLEHELAFDFDLNKFAYSTKFIFDASINCLIAMNDNGVYIKQIEELLVQWKKIEPVKF